MRVISDEKGDCTMDQRCQWAESHPLLKEYHDREWGNPVHDDRIHFEFLVLEGVQAGLSWLTVLKRRENYRQAYNDFDPRVVVDYNEEKIAELLNNPGVIRNRQKIRASIINAGKFLDIQVTWNSFDRYIWSFTDGRSVVNHWKKQENIPATSLLSDLISRDLKQKGFGFVGSTIIYAHLQATGIINDHVMNCFRYREILDHYI